MSSIEKFVVSARKYRPITFDSVVGQLSVTTTLKNAVRTGQVGHAYLFCGPRGVGKTTCARIFAKTINCLALTPETEPCNACESCTSFNESRSFNIHELDAASNNKVEDIRSLIDQVRISPQIGRYSIYIIDEVHMLSAAAFNAFLKTLEEPPAHAIFILATTEKSKIIPTILSRCQIFDFRRITIEDTIEHLATIAQREGISYEADGLNIIAQKADGAMRDALTIFDQMASFSGNNITYQEVISNLNVLDYDYFFQLTRYFLSGDVAGVLILYDEILRKGFEGHSFISGLMKHFRNLLVCQDEQTIVLLETGGSIKVHYLQQAKEAHPKFLFNALKISGEADTGFKLSNNQRLHVELMLIRLCQDMASEKKNPEPEVAEDTQRTPKTTQPPLPLTTLTPSPVSTADTDKPLTPAAEKSPGAVMKPTVSIKDALKGLENTSARSAMESEENLPDQNMVNEPEPLAPVGIEVITRAWEAFTESIKEEMPRHYHTLKNQPVLLDNEGQATIHFNNQAQLEDFSDRVKSRLAEFFIKTLKSPLKIELMLVKPGDELPQRPYTTEEKFRFLAVKNPALNKLRSEFNLDIR